MDYLTLAGELAELRARQFKTDVWRRMAKLAHGELLALYTLGVHGGTAYPRQLSAELAVSSARVAAMLRDMEAKGWVLRREDAGDCRQTVVALTDAGRAELTSRREQALAALAAALERLGPEDAEELLRLQRRMNEICTDR